MWALWLLLPLVKGKSTFRLKLDLLLLNAATIVVVVVDVAFVIEQPERKHFNDISFERSKKITFLGNGVSNFGNSFAFQAANNNFFQFQILSKIFFLLLLLSFCFILPLLLLLLLLSDYY